MLQEDHNFEYIDVLKKDGSLNLMFGNTGLGSDLMIKKKDADKFYYDDFSYEAQVYWEVSQKCGDNEPEKAICILMLIFKTMNMTDCVLCYRG